MPAPPFLVGIAGPSGSGKSTLAANAVAHWGAAQAALVSHDAYYYGLENVPRTAAGEPNFDHPDALESELLAAHLDALRSWQVIARPEYCFKAHARLGAAVVEPRPLVVVEGILVLALEALRDRFDLAVYVDADLDVCLERRVLRDQERGRTPASVRAQFEATVRPMSRTHVLPSREYADLVVSGEAGEALALRELHRAVVEVGGLR